MILVGCQAKTTGLLNATILKPSVHKILIRFGFFPEGVEARPSEGVPEQGDVQDFLKYMEELDQMYNKFARPR